MGSIRIRFGRIAQAATGIVGCLALVTAARAYADGWSPGLTLGTRFDRPVAGASGDEGEWIASVIPQLMAERLGPFTRWDLQAHRRYDASRQLTGLRQTHDVALGAFESQFAEHARATLDGAYFRSRDVLNPDPEAQLASSELSRASGAASLETWRGEAGYRVESSTFVSPGLADGRSQAWNAALFPMRSEQSRWLIGFRREEWTVAGRTELATSAATVGVRRHHTPFVSSELEVGAAWVADDLEGPAREELALAVGLSGLGHAQNLPFDARFKIRRDVSTGGMAEIQRPMAGALVALRWERSVHAGGGVFHEPTHRDFVAFEAQDTLGGRSILSLEGNYRRARPRSLAPGRLETWRAAASLSRDLRPWLRGRVRYSLAQQHASAGLVATDFDRNRLELSLSAVYQ
ncbi:MAG: hypothetical protein ACRENJ_05225 [Candidatus Eiseniibacteriota bacterium]